MSSSVFADIVTSQPLWGQLGVPKARYPLHGMGLHSTWNDHNKLRRKIYFREGCLQKRNTPIIRATLTLECTHLVNSENDSKHHSNLQLNSVPDDEVQDHSAADTPEMDEREKLRRLRISKANKGNVPWNKGRKHSAETLQKIRERTRIAMQDPKVKMKLVNLGHAQSEETRMKIGAGVREGWQRRREMLLLQETCCFEWQNMIAEASRKGYYTDVELYWDSYETLGKQLDKEWLESVEERKTTRPKGTKRAPKSPEQRRKIAAAITAKWAEPAYRDRVCNGLAKYHGIPPGAERRRMRKPVSERQSAERKTAGKKAAELKQSQNEVNLIKKVQRKIQSTAPSYKDPMASSKLEMIKKIREKRVTIEAKKREATERAKLLIAEAEKAANALEVAALKSPLARASLLETRKLIAEAVRSIERIEGGQLASKETGDNTTLNLGQPINHSNSGPEAYIHDRSADGQQGSSRPILSSNERNNVDTDFGNFSKQSSVNGREPSAGINGTKFSAEGLHNMYPSSSLSDSMRKHSDVTVTALQLHTCIPNGSSKYNDLPPRPEDQIPLQVDKVDGFVASITRTKKKWVRGRLVEVEED